MTSLLGHLVGNALSIKLPPSFIDTCGLQWARQLQAETPASFYLFSIYSAYNYLLLFCARPGAGSRIEGPASPSTPVARRLVGRQTGEQDITVQGAAMGDVSGAPGPREGGRPLSSALKGQGEPKPAVDVW